MSTEKNACREKGELRSAVHGKEACMESRANGKMQSSLFWMSKSAKERNDGRHGRKSLDHIRGSQDRPRTANSNEDVIGKTHQDDG